MRILLAIAAAGLLAACMAQRTRDHPPPRYDSPPPQSYQTAPAHASLHDRVHAALRDGMGAAASDITVRVEGTRVYLGGHVRTQLDHDRAHEIAHAVSGVTVVDHSALAVH
ncbi:MAG TPA: BON domain-containing protein [Gammaproteobacteria bacterium]|nr:BON domain-containing protein [Gammaproteobacteria bacterium]